MTLNINNLRQIIQSALTPLNLYSIDAEELLVATCAQESLLGTYRKQLGNVANGGLGIYQMEESDYNDIWNNFLVYHSQLSQQIKSIYPNNDATSLINDDVFSSVMCRVHYLRAPESLPSSNDLNAIWLYYKKYYNTIYGAATQIEFIRHYQVYVQNLS